VTLAARIALRIGLMLLAAALDIALLWPLLVATPLAPRQFRSAYFEPLRDGTAVMLGEQQSGYMNDVALSGRGDLDVPAGRTIGIPLEPDSEIVVRTLAKDLAPYVVVGSEVRTGDSAMRLDGALALSDSADGIAPQAWDASRPWHDDKDWLRRLYTRCGLGGEARVALLRDLAHVSIRLGACAATVQVNAPALLLVVAGPYAAVVSKPEPGWRLIREMQWPFVAVICVRVALFAFALGAGPTALASSVLFAFGQFRHAAAIVAWGITLPLALSAAVVRLVVWLLPNRSVWAAASGGAVFLLQIAGMAAAVAYLDIGTFGNERMTRDGDSGCSIVGYSTVRGDTLRDGVGSVVERLDDACAPCRGRTSRFSREAQTLRWIRQLVCSPSFPTPAGGEIVFLGGGNDDLFYHPTGLLRRVIVFAGMLRYASQPVATTDWESLFNQSAQSTVTTFDDQAADIDAIARCAAAGHRRFRFLHDFLVWDLERGRTPLREQAMERRRSAVWSAGGDFINLLDEFGQTAGVSWFNDFIHPSAVGHRMIADLLCTRMGSAPLERVEPAGNAGG
jgi:hypothetical protein